MAHFAQLNENNMVTQVIVVSNDDCLDSDGNESEAVGVAFLKNMFGSDTIWKQASYNTVAGKHYSYNDKDEPVADGGVGFRKNYPGIGMFYNEDIDAFIRPQPYPSWTLDATTGMWKPPVAHPNDSANEDTYTNKRYNWNESTRTWDERV